MKLLTKKTVMASHPGLVLCVVALSLALPFHAAAMLPDDYQEPVVDSRYASLVRQYTTDVNFLSPLVEQFPHDPDVPSPLEFLGYVPGAPQKLTYYNKIREYMEALAAASANVRLYSMGSSNEGKEMIVVAIADARILDDLDRYRSYTKALADPRVTNEERAGEIIRVARPIYYLTGGLHSTETGSPEMLMELAYRLAVGQSKLVQRIRKHVITLITPVLETDGRERMVDWYYRYTSEHTDWDDMPRRTPPYWGKYIFHDNNRDGIQLTQPLTRNLVRLYFDYHPQAMLDLHESIPLLYVSSGTGPYNADLDPIVTSEWQWMSNHEVTELTKLGMPGVWTWGFYTGWYPGYLLWFGNNHNSIGRFYETFGNAGATTIERELKGKFADREVTSRQWYRPWPPEKKIKWSQRNNTNYMETGVLASLDFVASNGKTILYNFWKKGANGIQRGKTRAPHAWVIPVENQDRHQLAYLVNNLRAQGVEVHRLAKNAKLGENRYKQGSFVVRLDQPYGPLAKMLLDLQEFPDDAEHRPYDDVAWTLPLLYGVDAEKINDPLILEQPMSLVEADVHLPGRGPKGKSRYYFIAASPARTLIEARVALQDMEVLAADAPFEKGGRTYPRGSWIVPAGADKEGASRRMEAIAENLSLDVARSGSMPKVDTHPVDLPRIAVFHTWTYTQDSGWLRYTLDQAGVPYVLINKDHLRRGGLRDRFDVILIPDLGRWFEPKQLVHGMDTKWGPMPYTQTADFPHHGIIDQTEDMTGGMGFEGLLNLERFIEEGGALVALGAGSLIPVEMGLVRGVDRRRPRGLHNPGSILRVRVTAPGSNIVAGYDTLTTVFRGNLPVFDVAKKNRSWVVMQYGTALLDDDGKPIGGDSKKTEPMCVSGHVKGEEHLAGKPAILDVRKGAGRVIIFSFNPMHRYLTQTSFGLVYNAILHWND